VNNTTLLWSILILSWVTLIFIKKEEIKRFMPAALFTAVSSGVIYQIGDVLKFWYLKDVAYSLLAYGPLPVFSLWILRFTYGRFWLYAIVNVILDLGFAFVVFPWCGRIGVLGIGPWTGIIVYIINFLHATLIYGYQMWQEGTWPKLK